MNKYLIPALLAVVVAFSLWVARDFFTGPKQTTQVAEPQVKKIVLEYRNPDIVRLGKEIYRQQCSSCHGADLQGEPNWQTRNQAGFLPAPPHNETGHTWHHPNEYLFAVVKRGVVPPLVPAGYKSTMYGFGNMLSNDQIIAVLSYIKSTWPEDIKFKHDQINQQASGQ